MDQSLLSNQDEDSWDTPQAQQNPAVLTKGASDWNQPDPDGATAPPADLMDVVPGYEGIGTAENVLPPPFQGPPQPNGPDPTQNRPWQIPSISEELAREAFVEFVGSKCCYSSRPSKEMVFTDLQSFNTYRLRLETFTESRSTDWASEPYQGQIVNEHGGVPPGPWDIPAQFPVIFQDASVNIRIPQSSSVKGCHSCLGLGKCACKNCVTSGMIQCPACRGSGRHLSGDVCSRCNGAGRVRCTTCSGVGSKTCKTCKGTGKLLWYIRLTVKWVNNVFESVVDKQPGFSVDRLSNVTGETVFTDMNLLVCPVVGFPENAINQASERAVREHYAQFSNTSRILQQRQTIELIPVTRVHYSWKGKTHIYFVYGAEHKVFTDDYPAKCCCCSIL